MRVVASLGMHCVGARVRCARSRVYHVRAARFAIAANPSLSILLQPQPLQKKTIPMINLFQGSATAIGEWATVSHFVRQAWKVKPASEGTAPTRSK